MRRSQSTEAPAGPFPGANPGRLHGRYGICTFAGFTLTVFDWEVEIRTEFVDATAHGDYWDIPVPLKYLWTARVRGYYVPANATYMHAAYANPITATPTDIAAASFVGYKDTTGTLAVFTGNGFVVRTRFAAPMAMVEQELEIRGAVQPGTTAF